MQNNSIQVDIKTLKATKVFFLKCVTQCKMTMSNLLTKLRKKMMTYFLEANALKQKHNERLADIKGINSSIGLLIKKNQKSS